MDKADATRDLDAAREALNTGLRRDGSITAEFEHIGKGKVSYSYREHTKTEAKYIPIVLFN